MQHNPNHFLGENLYLLLHWKIQDYQNQPKQLVFQKLSITSLQLQQIVASGLQNREAFWSGNPGLLGSGLGKAETVVARIQTPQFVFELSNLVTKIDFQYCVIPLSSMEMTEIPNYVRVTT